MFGLTTMGLVLFTASVVNWALYNTETETGTPDIKAYYIKQLEDARYTYMSRLEEALAGGLISLEEKVKMEKDMDNYIDSKLEQLQVKK